MTDKLAGLARHSVIVADSGEIALLRTLKAQDCTTNPSLILRAASRPEYAESVTNAIEWAEARESNAERRLDLTIDKLAVNFGTELSGSCRAMSPPRWMRGCPSMRRRPLPEPNGSSTCIARPGWILAHPHQDCRDLGRRVRRH